MITTAALRALSGAPDIPVRLTCGTETQEHESFTELLPKQRCVFRRLCTFEDRVLVLTLSRDFCICGGSLSCPARPAPATDVARPPLGTLIGILDVYYSFPTVRA